jgi:hypothetical protein
MLPDDWIAALQESVRLQELGIPTFDGDPQRPIPLREASAGALAARGIPLLDPSGQARQQAPAQTLAEHGIPMLSEPPAGAGQRRVKLTESTSGRVLGRIA